MASNFPRFFVLNISKILVLFSLHSFFSCLFLSAIYRISSICPSYVNISPFTLFFTYIHEKQMIYVKELL